MLVRFLDGHYVDRDACDRAFLRMHRRDRIGDRLHLGFACLGLICMFGPVTLTEIAFAPLLVFFLVRVFNTFPVWIHGFGQPVGLLGILLAGWMMISLNWSGDPFLGWGEISELRWFVLVGLIFPVIEQRKVLTSAMAIGIALGQIAQVFDAFDGFGIKWLELAVHHQPNRLGGWWHPVVGGAMLVGALGLHLPSMLFGVGRARLLALVLGSIAGIGIIATGTRGAWIAGVLLVIFAIGFGALTKRIRPKRVLLIVLGVVVVSGVGLAVMHKSVGERVSVTRTELTQIIDGDYDSMTGLRVKMGLVAIDAGLSHPIIGVGAGGYQAWSKEHEPDLIMPVHAHAHNSALHAWSTLGLVGVLLWGALITSMLRSSWRIWEADGSDGRPDYSGLGPMFAIVGLLLASLTHSLQVSTQTAAMLAVLAGLSPAYVPDHPQWRQDRPVP